MVDVVREPEHEVIGGSGLEVLHFLGWLSDFGNCELDIIFSLHETFILASDLLNDAWGVDLTKPLSPVDIRKTLVIGGHVKEFDHRGDLHILILSIGSRRGL